MLLSLLISNPIAFAIVAAILVVAVTIHEFAHAWMADRLGDPTPRYHDRITLNPMAHLDPLGSLAIVLVGFGWGKAVPFDPYNFKNSVRDTALVALAGPASNIILAILLAGVIKFVALSPMLGGAMELAIYFNVMLAVFNMVPIAPLDGSKILSALLPQHARYSYELLMSRYSIFILLAVIFPWSGTSIIATVVSPVIRYVVDLLV